MIRKLMITAALMMAAPLAAQAAECSVDLEGNDAMKFNKTSIEVPKACKDFTINLKHTGKLAANVMGHNVVIAKEADMAGIAADGAADPATHVKAGDTRAIAHSKVIGGGESTSVSFDVAKIKDGGPFKFFCSFPGHFALMQGSLQVQ